MRLLFLLVLLVSTVGAQPALVPELISDQETYAYGETITLRYTLTNEGNADYTFESSSTCVVGLTYGTLSLPTVCTADSVPYTISPQQTLSYVWILPPAELGVPETGGEQTVWGYLGIGWAEPPSTHPTAASATFEAPRFLGGPLSVGFDAADADSVAALRESLGGTVTYSVTYADGSKSERWVINGVALADAIATLEASDVIQWAERSIQGDFSFATANEAAPDRARLTAPAPNPTAARATFTLRLGRTEAVTVDLSDALGRRLAVLHDGPLAGDVEHTFWLEAQTLPAGVYVVRAVGETVRQSQRVTIAR
ncbi:T9SS type A sorting domain-containing protein [Rubrivirga sp.]|uniref:T9SS type A sorting domain-containing protein n=1 Tax=Rubrivirga sp. TaxID=1885344 RepID=UPI003B5293E7